METVSRTLRSLVRMRLTAIAVLLTLAAGATANVVVFALVNAVMLRPLPYSEPQQLVALSDHVAGRSVGVSWGEVQQWGQAPKLFQSAAVYSRRTWALTDSSGAGLDVVLSGMVSPGFFQVLNVSPLLGTSFDPREGAGADEHVVLLSHALWQNRYGGDPAALRGSVRLNNVAYKIVGVLPPVFRFPLGGDVPDLWIPLARKDYCCQLSQRGLDAIGRLRPGLTPGQASARLDALGRATARAEGLRQLNSGAEPLQSFLAQGQRRTLLLLWASVFALGLVAALNAGALLLARSLRNLHQYALRLSLGATFGRLLKEQIALAVALALGALAVALLGSRTLLSILLVSPLFGPLIGNAPRAGSLWDWRVFLFSGVLSFAAALTACVLPLAAVRGLAVEQLLRSHTGFSSSRRGRSLRTRSIVAQLGLSVMLVSVVSSLGHSLYAVLARDPGFGTHGVVMAGIGIPDARYDTDAKMVGFHERALASIRTLPGVRAAGFGAGLPVHPLKTSFLLDGSALPPTDRPRVDIAFASPDLLHLLGISIVRGRGFTSQDGLNQPLSVILNQAFARQYLDRADPLQKGMRIQFYNGVSMQPWSRYTVIGVVADSRNRSIDREPEPQLYLSTDQVPLEGGEYFLATDRSVQSLLRELPAAVWRVDPQVQRVSPFPAEQFVESGFSDRRASLYLATSFAFMALCLATIGLAASISAGVSESTREIGIRTALGERRSAIAARVLRSSLGRTLLGTALGVFGSVALSRVISVSLDPTLHFDFRVVPAVVGVMLLVAVVVSISPVRRALQVSPAAALRAE